MQDKAKKWFDLLTASQLHRRMMWFSVDRQMWPSVKYGFCCNMATLPELDSVLMPLYEKMLPLKGIVSKANWGIRQLDRGFYGAGFPHPGVEATLEQANKLLMHYGCRTALGTELQTYLELLVVDLGLSFQPFQVSYKHYGDWVTTSWLKRVWEKVSFFGFTISVNNLLACNPREGDDWLMSQFIARGYTANKLAVFKSGAKTPASSFPLCYPRGWRWLSGQTLPAKTSDRRTLVLDEISTQGGECPGDGALVSRYCAGCVTWSCAG
jgi:hypothetical protein